jgi:hypothetical protein
MNNLTRISDSQLIIELMRTQTMLVGEESEPQLSDREH